MVRHHQRQESPQGGGPQVAVVPLLHRTGEEGRRHQFERVGGNGSRGARRRRTRLPFQPETAVSGVRLRSGTGRYQGGLEPFAGQGHVARLTAVSCGPRQKGEVEGRIGDNR